MTKTSKILLTISVTAFVLSLTEAGSSIGWGILRPVGAVAFIAFFISNLLAKEMALYDEEERAKQSQAETSRKEPPKPVPSLRGARSSTTLEPAVAH
jgi:hypothetical protein